MLAQLVTPLFLPKSRSNTTSNGAFLTSIPALSHTDFDTKTTRSGSPTGSDQLQPSQILRVHQSHRAARLIHHHDVIHPMTIQRGQHLHR